MPEVRSRLLLCGGASRPCYVTCQKPFQQPLRPQRSLAINHSPHSPLQTSIHLFHSTTMGNVRDLLLSSLCPSPAPAALPSFATRHSHLPLLPSGHLSYRSRHLVRHQRNRPRVPGHRPSPSPPPLPPATTQRLTARVPHAGRWDHLGVGSHFQLPHVWVLLGRRTKGEARAHGDSLSPLVSPAYRASLSHLLEAQADLSLSLIFFPLQSDPHPLAASSRHAPPTSHPTVSTRRHDPILFSFTFYLARPSSERVSKQPHSSAYSQPASLLPL